MYAKNCPVRYVDPSGNSCLPWLIAAIVISICLVLLVLVLGTGTSLQNPQPYTPKYYKICRQALTEAALKKYNEESDREDYCNIENDDECVKKVLAIEYHDYYSVYVEKCVKLLKTKSAQMLNASGQASFDAIETAIKAIAVKIGETYLSGGSDEDAEEAVDKKIEEYE
jgi:hypothetical protein